MSDLMTRAVIMMPLDLAMSSELSRLQFHSRAQDVLHERDTYRELCVELVKALSNHIDQTRPIWESVDVIVKAEAILGEQK